ncbi:RNA polymerase sigma factor, sigma-70 family [bacterium A37T11]|nr:RNA polymerase sigma factor, sigma-70 family [bacterium A37T11]
MNNLTDQEILRLIRQSDRMAFDILYDRFWKPLYLHALKKTGSKDDASDLLQDLFLELWNRRLHLPEISVPLRYYMRSIMVYKVAHYFREKRFKEKHEENFAAFIQQENNLYNIPIVLNEDNFDFESAIEQVQACVSQLPDRMKEIFQMRHMENYSISYIAETLQLSKQTVHNQLQNALHRLRLILLKKNISAKEILLLLLFTQI